ncbi:MAG: anhydro-N-acetylmuramic acid kinase [Planctomycetota bacterium]|nr:anhydro-N-acetylmuramic acid kinase [Planctomycetota bacterium]
MPKRTTPNKPPRPLRAAGLMSGTSADGVSVAFVDVRGRRVRLLGHLDVPYTPAFRRRVFELFDPATSRVDAICRMNFQLGEIFAGALNAAAKHCRVPLASLDVIGSHGQTIYHCPPARGRAGSTLQIGEPAVIAERTGVTTVADFRPADVAAGGQGAPLVPLADWLLFAHRARHRVVQNIGGIANLTWLPARAGLADVLAFDTGPGNMILDRLASLITRGRLAYDRDGLLAAQGRVCPKLLAHLLRHPFLRQRPPKSTGRETFGLPFTDALLARSKAMGISPLDTLATATAFTAASIARAYRFLPSWPAEVILCGGGARNPTLVSHLGRELSPARVVLMDTLGIPAEAKESVSFALLAVRTLLGQSGNVPSATGARHHVVLGKIVAGAGLPSNRQSLG